MINMKHLNRLLHSPIRNYAGIPGLTSWLVGGVDKEHGTVRLLSCSRDHQENIIPHSHRFDLSCNVLEGSVKNIVWTPSGSASTVDKYQKSKLVYKGAAGKYLIDDSDPYIGPFEKTSTVYEYGDEYFMDHKCIHSIFFSRGTKVLMFEGPTVADHSFILEPYVNDEVVKTFIVPSYANKRGL